MKAREGKLHCRAFQRFAPLQARCTHHRVAWPHNIQIDRFLLAGHARIGGGPAFVRNGLKGQVHAGAQSVIITCNA